MQRFFLKGRGVLSWRRTRRVRLCMCLGVGWGGVGGVIFKCHAPQSIYLIFVTHKHTHTCTRTSMHKLSVNHTHTYRHTRTQSVNHTNTHSHTHTHTHTQMCALPRTTISHINGESKSIDVIINNG